LGRISGLVDGLTKGRKYGLRIVAGLQTISQLRSEYGRESAQTILANFSNWVVLRAPDSESSDYFSKSFGQVEYTREETSKSTSSGSGGGGTNTSVRHVTEAAVLASQISGLRPLNGYLRLADQPANIYQIAVPICELGEASMPAYSPPQQTNFLKA
jgi:type IV secretory pathway TraG/TraD family ATPase VirD4